MSYQNDWDINKYTSLHQHLRVLLWSLRGDCASIPIHTFPLRGFLKEKKSKIVQIPKAIQQISFPTSLADKDAVP